MITVQNLRKTFRIPLREKGMAGAVKGLFHREYREINAIDDISFSIDKGELVGYIGPNGAGKSTTVKILSGILVPTSGHCEIDGRVPWKDRKKHVARIGVVFGQRTQLWWDLPAAESFDLLRDIYSIPHSQYEKTSGELIELLGLKSILDIPVRQMSLGQRMRCDIAASLLHSPDILFLDEPTIGLDAEAKIAIRKFIRKINKQRNITVILTTHDMDDIEALCSRIMVIGQGSIVYEGTLMGLRDELGGEKHLVIDFAEDDVKLREEHLKIVERSDRKVRVCYVPKEFPTKDLLSRIAQNYPVADMAVENPPIEEIVARLYREKVK